jgi:hypothetical protein
VESKLVASEKSEIEVEWMRSLLIDFPLYTNLVLHVCSL